MNLEALEELQGNACVWPVNERVRFAIYALDCPNFVLQETTEEYQILCNASRRTTDRNIVRSACHPRRPILLRRCCLPLLRSLRGRTPVLLSAVSLRTMDAARHPLLYNNIVLRSAPQALALHRALKANPDFGRLITRLRIEGGYGNAVKEIIKFAPNIRDLMLTFAIWHPDSSSGLTQAIGGMANVQRVGFIHLADELIFPKSKAVAALLERVCECIAGD